MDTRVWRENTPGLMRATVENTHGHPRSTGNLKIFLDTRVQQWISQYSWTPACDSQLENTSRHPCLTVNLKIFHDTRVRQWIRKYSWTPACDSQLENTPGRLCDSHFPKGVSALSRSFPLPWYWNIGTRQTCMKWLLIIRHVNGVKNVNSVHRGEICPCRHCRRQCKIFAGSVNFSRNNTIYKINKSAKYILSWFHL